MAPESLSRRQRQILALMRDHGRANFLGFTREFYWRVSTQGGVVIWAYQRPEYFLAARRLIEKIPDPTKESRLWYRLTPAGAKAAVNLPKQ